MAFILVNLSDSLVFANTQFADTEAQIPFAIIWNLHQFPNDIPQMFSCAVWVASLFASVQEGDNDWAKGRAHPAEAPFIEEEVFLS